MERIKTITQNQQPTTHHLQSKQEEAKSTYASEIFPEKATNENEIIERLEKVLDEDFTPKLDEEIKKLSDEEKAKYCLNQNLLKSIIKNPANYEKLVALRLRSKLADELDSQGGIGAIWSALKNKFDFGASSEKAEETINNFEQGKITDEEAKEAVNEFIEGQSEAVDITADIITGVTAVGTYTGALAVSVGTFGLGAAPAFAAATATTAVVGAATKIGIKSIDTSVIGNKKYTLKNAIYDGTTGAVDGMIAPIAQGLGGTIAKTAVANTGVKAAGTIGKTVCIESIKTAGKETTKKTLLESIKKTGTQVAFNPAGFIYSGGTTKAKAIAYALESGVSGAINGSVANGTRAALKGEDIGTAVLTGASAGAALGSVTTLRVKGLGKGANKAFQVVDDFKCKTQIIKVDKELQSPKIPSVSELMEKLEKEVA